jgi:neopullulanase
MLDGVFNHASRGFFQFHDIMENGPNSAYLDWFHVSGFPLNAYDVDKKPNYGAWWGLRALPKFNTGCPEVREFLWGIGRRWIDFGIDGWRLDVPSEIDDDSFWREFRRRVKAGNPDAYIVGEVWTDAPRWLQGDMWDAVMNYHFTRASIAFFIGKEIEEQELRQTCLFPPGPQGAEGFRKAIERLIGLYAPSVTAVMLNLLGSHDMARFLTLARADRSALRLATVFQMTYPGAPSIYYGDEIGMQGGHDPANRGAFPWHKTESWDTELLHEFQRLIALRRARPALRRGSFRILHAAGELFAHARQLGDETFVVVFNTARSNRRLDLRLHGLVADGTILEDIWTRHGSRAEHDTLHLELAPRSSLVLATPRRV